MILLAKLSEEKISKIIKLYILDLYSCWAQNFEGLANSQAGPVGPIQARSFSCLNYVHK